MGLNLESNLSGQARETRALVGSWRVTVSASGLLVFLILCANVWLLVWVKQNRTISVDGTATVFEGSCETGELGMLWPELIINILSTLLLGASNSCSHILSSPTRQAMDKALAKGEWLDVGVPSFRNLKHIPSQRVFLWALLFLSSIPLHFIYNSVVFRGQAWVNFHSTVVTEDFPQGGWWNDTFVHNTTQKTQVQQMQTSAMIGNLSRMENTECLRIYNDGRYQNKWKNVLLVSSITHNGSVIGVGNEDTDIVKSYSHGLCGFDLHSRASCSVEKQHDGSTIWAMDFSSCFSSKDYECPPLSVPIAYCLAEQFPPRCTIQVNLALLSIVIGMNIIKLGCFVATALSRNNPPLRTFGDAIVSFLEHPDETTANMGAISMNMVWKKRHRLQDKDGACPFNLVPRGWYSAVDASQWWICIGLSSAVGFAGFICMVVTLNSNSVKGFSQGFSGNAENRMPSTIGKPLMANVVLANTPQAILSLLHYLYEKIITYMVQANEYGQFASVRKPLRVSQPCGQQRTSFWVQLPFRYNFSIMAIMAVLHWSVSRSLYLIQGTIYGSDGNEYDSQALTGCGFSGYAIMVSLGLGLVLGLLLLALSVRQLNPGIPIAGSCSIAISAAAYAARKESNASSLPLQYGVIVAAGVDELGRQRVGFSSGQVEPLVHNGVYI